MHDDVDDTTYRYDYYVGETNGGDEDFVYEEDEKQKERKQEEIDDMLFDWACTSDSDQSSQPVVFPASCESVTLSNADMFQVLLTVVINWSLILKFGLRWMPFADVNPPQSVESGKFLSDRTIIV